MSRHEKDFFNAYKVSSWVNLVKGLYDENLEGVIIPAGKGRWSCWKAAEWWKGSQSPKTNRLVQEWVSKTWSDIGGSKEGTCETIK